MAGLDVTMVGSPDRYHFDIILDLARRDTALGAAARRQMGQMGL